MSVWGEQIAVPCVLMRGGTSKALFFHERDVPHVGDARDRFLKRVMGTPDVLQIDGLGGSRLVTSKAAIICKSQRQDADVDYTFAQIDVDRDVVGYEGNCGNISSAVGPFAIDEGLVEAVEPVTTVRVYNTNTDKILVAKVPVLKGKARLLGGCVVAGVPGAGAEILMDYSGTVGAKFGKLLPSGNVVDTVSMEAGPQVSVTVCDVGNPCVFVDAASVGLTGAESPAEITANATAMRLICEIQAKVGQRLGMWSDWSAQHKPGLPLAVLVSAAKPTVGLTGAQDAADGMDLCARLVFLGKCHDSMAGTGSVCTAAASRVAGSVVNRLLHDTTSTALRIGHPLGVMEVKVATTFGSSATDPAFAELGFSRTARRLMAGEVYVPVDTTTVGH